MLAVQALQSQKDVDSTSSSALLLCGFVKITGPLSAVPPLLW